MVSLESDSEMDCVFDDTYTSPIGDTPLKERMPLLLDHGIDCLPGKALLDDESTTILSGLITDSAAVNIMSEKVDTEQRPDESLYRSAKELEHLATREMGTMSTAISSIVAILAEKARNDSTSISVALMKKMMTSATSNIPLLTRKYEEAYLVPAKDGQPECSSQPHCVGEDLNDGFRLRAFQYPDQDDKPDTDVTLPHYCLLCIRVYVQQQSDNIVASQQNIFPLIIQPHRNSVPLEYELNDETVISPCDISMQSEKGDDDKRMPCRKRCKRTLRQNRTSENISAIDKIPLHYNGIVAYFVRYRPDRCKVEIDSDGNRRIVQVGYLPCTDASFHQASC